MNRTCTICGVSKPLDDFQSYVVRGKRGYYYKCRVCHAAAQRVWHSQHKERRREVMLMRDYGITATDYDAMMAAQSGRCKICNDPPHPKKKLAVDHCHDTGRIRGLLCDPCNIGIGYMQDSIERLKQAENYLQPIGSDEHLLSLIYQGQES